MPKGDPQGRMHGFQLWANLPASLKMTTPRYQDVLAKDIPEEVDDDGTRIRVIVGDFRGKKGPVEGVAADPNYIDVSVPPGKTKRLAVETSRHAFAYVFAGSGTFREASAPLGVLTEQVVDGSGMKPTWRGILFFAITCSVCGTSAGRRCAKGDGPVADFVAPLR